MISRCYAVLAPISRCYSPLKGRLLTRYSPVRHSAKIKSKLSFLASFDLHVLGTPPAFILSQDQTLKKILRAIWLFTYHFINSNELNFGSLFSSSAFYSIFKIRAARLTFLSREVLVNSTSCCSDCQALFLKFFSSFKLETSVLPEGLIRISPILGLCKSFF